MCLFHNRSAKTAERTASLSGAARSRGLKPGGELGRDFNEQPIVVYNDFGLHTVFVIDPELSRRSCSTTSKLSARTQFTIAYWERAAAKGLLIAEGELWRWLKTPACAAVARKGDCSLRPDFCRPVRRCCSVGGLRSRFAPADPFPWRLRRYRSLEDTVFGADLARRTIGASRRRCGGSPMPR